jgi:hypothetical protein
MSNLDYKIYSEQEINQMVGNKLNLANHFNNFRVDTWLNFKDLSVFYGIEAKEINGKWVKLHVDGKALFVRDQPTAKKICKNFRKAIKQKS